MHFITTQLRSLCGGGGGVEKRNLNGQVFGVFGDR